VQTAACIGQYVWQEDSVVIKQYGHVYCRIAGAASTKHCVGFRATTFSGRAQLPRAVRGSTMKSPDTEPAGRRNRSSSSRLAADLTDRRAAAAAAAWSRLDECMMPAIIAAEESSVTEPPTRAKSGHGPGRGPFRRNAARLVVNARP